MASRRCESRNPAGALFHLADRGPVLFALLLRRDSTAVSLQAQSLMKGFLRRGESDWKKSTLLDSISPFPSGRCAFDSGCNTLSTVLLMSSDRTCVSHRPSRLNHTTVPLRKTNDSMENRGPMYHRQRDPTSISRSIIQLLSINQRAFRGIISNCGCFQRRAFRHVEPRSQLCFFKHGEKNIISAPL